MRSDEKPYLHPATTYARDYATNNTFLAVIGTYHMPQECALYDSVVTVYYLFVLLCSVDMYDDVSLEDLAENLDIPRAMFGEELTGEEIMEILMPEIDGGEKDEN